MLLLYIYFLFHAAEQSKATEPEPKRGADQLSPAEAGGNSEIKEKSRNMRSENFCAQNSLIVVVRQLSIIYYEKEAALSVWFALK